MPNSEVDPSLVLRFDHVTKRYGDHTVVNDLTFTVQPGRVTGFLGPNGSGKSTAMKILLGLAAANEGTATIGDRTYRELEHPTRTVGAALETNAFHPGRTGRNHLRILARAAGIRHERVAETLTIVGLADAADRHVGTYSLGMRQRLGLATALLGDPPILVLDEPGNGLDPQGVRSLRELLRQRASQGHTVFVSSHLLAEVEHLADDVVVIDDGCLAAHGPLSELQSNSVIVRSSNNPQLANALTTAGASVEHGDDQLIVSAMPIEEIGERAFSTGITIHELAHHAGSLEEMFLELTRTAERSEGGAIHL